MDEPTAIKHAKTVKEYFQREIHLDKWGPRDAYDHLVAMFPCTMWQK